MTGIGINDVSKIFQKTQNLTVLNNIKRNAVLVRRLFDMSCAAQFIPSHIVAMNRKNIMDEICIAYGFKDFADAENCIPERLSVFNKPLKKNKEVDWKKSIRNQNYSATETQIKSAVFVSNKIFSYVLKQGVNNELFNTLLNFKSFKLDNSEIGIDNNGFGIRVLNSPNLLWELWFTNVSQLAVSSHKFDAANLKITLEISDLGDFDGQNIDVLGALKQCPDKLIGGNFTVSEDGTKISFYFSKKLFERFKQEKYSFSDAMGLRGFSNQHLLAT